MSRFEVRCPDCDEDYLLERESFPDGAGAIPCVKCGGMVPVAVPEEEAACPEAAPPPVKVKPRTKEATEVVCPRCRLHFVPRTSVEQDPNPDRRTVLVVEDMEYFREIARDALGERYNVRTADSAAEALRILHQGGIDLLVLDLTLEHTEDGFGMLTQLQPKPCPILIYTAEDEADMYGQRWDELQQYGADDLVIKGMNVGDMLTKKVEELFGDSGTGT